jgi:hypothetical protein
MQNKYLLIKNRIAEKSRLYKKGGLSDYALWWVGIKIFITVLVCVVVFIMSQTAYSSIEQGSREIDTSIIANSLMYSPVLMNYDSLLGRVDAGNINETKFTNPKALSKELSDYMVLPQGVNYVAMKITLIVGNDKKSVYYNEPKYLEWYEMYKGGFSKAEGGYTYRQIPYQVTVGKARKPGVLLVEVVVPNG